MLAVAFCGGWDGGLFRCGGNTIADGGLIIFGANQFQLDYDAGGISVALIVVPEPRLLSGVACVAGLRRRRVTPL